MFSKFSDILNKVYIDRFPRSFSLTEEDMGEETLHRLRTIMYGTEVASYISKGLLLWGDVAEDQERIHRCGAV